MDASGRDYHDNALRFGLLSRVAAQLGTVHSPLRGWSADVVHANDWPCGPGAAVPRAPRALVAPQEPTAASVVTIHNLAFQGVFPMASADLLGVPHHWRGMDGVEFWGQLSMLKAGLQFADAITTVSPTYAREIQTPAHGVGFDGILRARARACAASSTASTPALEPRDATRCCRTTSRATAAGQGFLQGGTAGARGAAGGARGDAVRAGEPAHAAKGRGPGAGCAAAAARHRRAAGGAGPGRSRPCSRRCRTAAQKHPKQVAVTLGFDEGLAHLIEAGADVFLMPSRFEPCGLNQMYSQAYGTPPIVAPVGGLLDSVTDASADPVHGTGFVMTGCDPAGLEDAIARAQRMWREPQRWRRIQGNGMARHFGWEDSALQYLEVYQRAALLAAGAAARYRAAV